MIFLQVTFNLSNCQFRNIFVAQNKAVLFMLPNEADEKKTNIVYSRKINVIYLSYNKIEEEKGGTRQED